MVYVQKKSVKGVPNPPRKGRLSVFNNRSEGYADYKPGMYYVSVFDSNIRNENKEVAAVTAEEIPTKPTGPIVKPRAKRSMRRRRKSHVQSPSEMRCFCSNHWRIAQHGQKELARRYG